MGPDGSSLTEFPAGTVLAANRNWFSTSESIQATARAHA
jgi:hypothetical protein